LPSRSPVLALKKQNPYSITAQRTKCHAKMKLRARISQQWLSGANASPFGHVIAELEVRRRQHDDGRAVLEPAEFLARAT